MAHLMARRGLCRLLCVLCLAIAAHRSSSLDIPDDSKLASMTSEELGKIEDALRQEVEQTNKELSTLKADTSQLHDEQVRIDKEAEQLIGAKHAEEEEKAKRDKELEAAKTDVLAKQAAISKMSIRVTELKDQISSLERKLVQLSKEKIRTEQRYQDPSLTDVLDSRSQNWGSVSRNVYNKTKENLVPAFSEISAVARHYQHQVSRTSRALELVVSALVYGFLIGAAYITYTIYNKLRGRLTVDRLLFLGDAYCACFWVVILVCFFLLFDDPLFIVQQRSPRIFFLFQLITICSYISFVLLRVLVLASKMTIGALGETLAVVVVGQHYYVRVWQPSILDETFHGTFFYYFCYAWLFGAFAYNRVDQFSPLKQVKGAKLSPLANFRIMFARFTRGRIPDGDLQTELSPGKYEDDESVRIPVAEAGLRK